MVVYSKISVFILFFCPALIWSQCQQPFGISFTGKGKNFVEFRWTDPNQSPLGWDVEVVKKGNSPTGLPLNSTPLATRMYKAENLQPSTFYEIYIRTVCSTQNRSVWNGPFIVSTVLENPTACPVNLDMKDNGTETFSIDIDDEGILGQTIFISSVDIIAKHEWPADLRITLINPAGKSIILSEYHGTGGVNFGIPGDALCFQSTHFSDQACEPLVSQKPPFNGTYLPHQPLSTLHDNTPSKGRWQVVFHDRAAFHRGSLVYLRIHLSNDNCQLPEVFFLSDINSNSVTAEWEPSPQCQTIKITIKEKGKPDDQEVVYFLNCLDRSFTIPGLTPETEYEIFYQSVCGFSLSEPSCKESFRTNCKPVSTSESFDDLSPCTEACQIPCNVSGVWANIDENNQDWLVRGGKTDTEDTGPDADISGSGQYVYIEAQPSICGTDAVVLQSVCLQLFSNPDGCDFSFYYHMYGAGTGSLSLQISVDNGTTWETLWTKSGNQGNVWQRAYISLADYHQTVAVLRFLATPENSIYGDIAIDQVEFYGTLPVQNLFRYYRDNDGDGFGDISVATDLCQSFPPAGFVVNGQDCDDNNEAINPDGAEIPCNLTDENCNGMADDTDPAFDLVYDVDVVHESCKGEKNGRIHLSISGGQPPYQVRWHTGEQTEDLIGIGEGIYYCTISDASGCSVQSTFITVNAMESIQYLVTGLNRPTCSGITDGSIMINHSGGQSPFSYAWSSGQTTKDLAPAGEGMYTLTITDINGCRVVTAPIHLPSLPGISAGAVQLFHPTCFDTRNGIIELGVVNGVPPYEFQWQNGMNSARLQQVGPGIYSCTITDSRGCLTLFSTTLQAPQKLEPLLISTEPVRCFGEKNGIIKTTTRGGTPPYLYFWNNAAFDDDLFDLGAGMYSMTVTDRNGCKAVLDNIEVSQPDVLTGRIDTILKARCLLGNNGSIKLSADGGSPPYHYSWNTIIFQDTATLSGLATGVYSAIIYDSRGCKFNMGSLTVPFENVPVEIHEAIIQGNRCFGDSEGKIVANIVSGQAPFDYNWSNGIQYIKDGDIDTIQGLPPGTYTLTITDTEGCIGVSSPLTLPYIDQISYTVRQITQNPCNTDIAGIISLEVQNIRGTAEVIWNSGASGITIDSLPNGIYQASISDSSGCMIQTESILMTSVSDLMVSYQAENTRPGLSEGKICLDVNGASGQYTITWDEKITNFSGTCAFDLPAGTYVINISDELGCEIQKTVIIQERVSTEQPETTTCGFYPNPTTGLLFSQHGCTGYGLRLFNAQGLLLYTKRPSEPFDFPDLTDKPSGLYIIMTDLPGKRILTKIIKL